MNYQAFLQRLSTSTTTITTQRLSRHSMQTLSEFHAGAPQATVSEGLAQVSYVAARAGFEPMTLWVKGDGINQSILLYIIQCCVPKSSPFLFIYMYCS